MPYGMLPVLEIDGKPIAQSNAVARYLARKHNLAGRDEWESMLCDVLVDTLGDLKQCKRHRYNIRDDSVKEKLPANRYFPFGCESASGPPKIVHDESLHLSPGNFSFIGQVRASIDQ